MVALDVLHEKRILVVDDEPDVLEVVRDELADCDIVTAGNFEVAQQLILTDHFDLVILDIMGVNGFALLERCRDRKMPAAMLTAHAISLDSLNKALRLGAVSFLPKEELARLPELLTEILQGLAEGRSHWPQLFKRLGPFFKERLGIVWDDLEKPPYPPYAY